MKRTALMVIGLLVLSLPASLAVVPVGQARVLALTDYYICEMNWAPAEYYADSSDGAALATCQGFVNDTAVVVCEAPGNSNYGPFRIEYDVYRQAGFQLLYSSYADFQCVDGWPYPA